VGSPGEGVQEGQEERGEEEGEGEGVYASWEGEARKQPRGGEREAHKG